VLLAGDKEKGKREEKHGRGEKKTSGSTNEDREVAC
jgi:hypothetical protein